jgi:hypothetical protein
MRPLRHHLRRIREVRSKQNYVSAQAQDCSRLRWLAVGRRKPTVAVTVVPVSETQSSRVPPRWRRRSGMPTNRDARHPDAFMPCLCLRISIVVQFFFGAGRTKYESDKLMGYGVAPRSRRGENLDARGTEGDRTQPGVVKRERGARVLRTGISRVQDFCA